MFRAEDARRPSGRAAWPSCIATRRPPNRLRESLTEAQARKTSILESSLDPIITINHEGVIIEFNRAAEQTFGYSAREGAGHAAFRRALSALAQRRAPQPHRALPGGGRRLDARQARRGHGLAGQRRGVSRRDGHDDQPDQRRAGDDVLRPRHQRAARRPKRSRPATRPSWSGPTATWSSSPTWPRTTCRSRCARSAPSATAWK